MIRLTLAAAMSLGLLAAGPLRAETATPPGTAQEATAPAELVMFEETGCIYCARWKAEVGDAYARTAEGRAAPLRLVNLDDPLPEDLEVDRPVVFSPTFVLAVEGAEVARLEGYPGEDFFWGLLGMMLDQNNVPLDGLGPSPAPGREDTGGADVSTGH